MANSGQGLIKLQNRASGSARYFVLDSFGLVW